MTTLLRYNFIQKKTPCRDHFIIRKIQLIPLFLAHYDTRSKQELHSAPGKGETGSPGAAPLQVADIPPGQGGLRDSLLSETLVTHWFYNRPELVFPILAPNSYFLSVRSWSIKA